MEHETVLVTTTDPWGEGSLGQALQIAEQRPVRIAFIRQLDGKVIAGDYGIERPKPGLVLDARNVDVTHHGEIRLGSLEHPAEQLEILGWRGLWAGDPRVPGAKPLQACLRLPGVRGLLVSESTIGLANGYCIIIVGAARDVVFERSLILWGIDDAENHVQGEKRYHSKGLHFSGSSRGRYEGFPDRITVRECGLIGSFARQPQAVGDANNRGGEFLLESCVVAGWGHDQPGRPSAFGTQFARGAHGLISGGLYVAWPGSDPSKAILRGQGHGDLSVTDTLLQLPDGEVVDLSDGDPGPSKRPLQPAVEIRRRLAAMRIWGKRPWGGVERAAFQAVTQRDGIPGAPPAEVG